MPAELAVVIMRGGTSKGVFCRLADLPPAGPERDRLLLDVMGSPDPMQLDGLGGTHSSTSKVMAVGPSAVPGIDVEYLFAQVGIGDAVVEYTGNCGNLTAAIGPYAIDEGLAPADGRPLVLLNLNTNVRIRATVAVDRATGRAAWAGDTAIDGVPGTGAPIVTDYLDPAGSVTGQLFPTGSPCDVVGGVAVSVVDVASPHAFVEASAFGLGGQESPAELNARPDLLDELEAVRAAAGRLAGLDSRAVPRLVMISPPSAGGDLRVQATSMQKVHHATPITGALCTAAAARLGGTVASRPGGPIVRIEHPKGLVEATIHLDGQQVVAAGVVRTARRLLAGTAYLKT